MTRIAPVRMKMNPRTYWFDAGDFDIEKDQKVVVQTVRGTELATVAESVFEPDDDQVCALKTPLKPIVRIATEDDIEQDLEMERLSAEAMPVFRSIVEECKLDMRPVSVEYLLDGDKAVFYFESEERIDFRDLVRKLAAHFHVRVDMRQIGVRDEARMIGGLGHCGQELCCARMGGEFNPVSIRMAKEQDLSLNPQKISGTCGRLMCCLRYEYDAYKDFNSRAPKKNATIQTPEGPAKVIGLDVPREIVTIKLEAEDAKPVKVPLGAFEVAAADASKDKVRPNAIGKKAWDEALSQDEIRSSIDGLFLTSQFTQDDKVGSAKAIYHDRKQKDEGEQKANRARRNRGKQNRSHDSQDSSSVSDRKRRRSTKISSSSSAEERVTEPQDSSSEKRVRPGQKSSGLRASQIGLSGNARDEANGASSEKKGNSSGRRRPTKRRGSGKEASQGNSAILKGQQSGSVERAPRDENTPDRGNTHRRPRRRTHKSGSGQSSDSQNE